MSKSVKEMTVSLKTNKNVIYRIIEKLGLEPIPSDDKKAPKEYSDEDYQAIKRAFYKLQTKHNVIMPETNDNSELLAVLQSQIKKNDLEIQRLNDVIAQKDALIKDLTDKLTETTKANHLENMRYQELLAREQDAKLLLTAQAQSRFNIFRPSTWKRNKPETTGFEPLTKDIDDHL